jgi:hypothetical protein
VRGTLFDPAFGGLSGRYPTGQGIIPFEVRGALQSGLAYLSRCNSGWFCHTHVVESSKHEVAALLNWQISVLLQANTVFFAVRLLLLPTPSAKRWERTQ